MSRRPYKPKPKKQTGKAAASSTSADHEESVVANVNTFAPSPPQLKASTEKETAPRKQNSDASFDRRSLAWKRPDWWIASLTALLCLITYLQWRAARESIDDGRKALVISNRAYLAVKDARIYRTVKTDATHSQILGREQPAHLIPGDFAALELNLTNSGNTPARQVKSVSVIDIKDVPPPDNTTSYHGYTADVAQSVGVVQKEAGFLARGITDRPLSDIDLADIERGKKFLVIYGVTSYKDMFGADHLTRFSYMYTPSNVYSISPCPTHNYMD